MGAAWTPVGTLQVLVEKIKSSHVLCNEWEPLPLLMGMQAAGSRASVVWLMFCTRRYLLQRCVRPATAAQGLLLGVHGESSWC